MKNNKLKIIGLLGKARVGKDTSGEMLCESNYGKHIALADKLKDIAMEMFELTYEQVYGDLKETPTKHVGLACPTCSSVEISELTLGNDKMGQCNICNVIGALPTFKKNWTPRHILQYLGTEGFRKIWPDVWVNYAVRRARGILLNGFDEIEKQANTNKKKTTVPNFVVFTDLRFANEAAAVWSAGGEVWRIKRPEHLLTTVINAKAKMHASETEQDEMPDSLFQAVIDNDGSFDALRKKLNDAFNRFNKTV